MHLGLSQYYLKWINSVCPTSLLLAWLVPTSVKTKRKKLVALRGSIN